MERLGHKTSRWSVGGLAILFFCGGLVPGGFAAEGDSPLEAYFLPHDTELSGIIGAEYTADYYKVIVPATGRLIVRLYDINLNDTRDELNLSLFRTTRNSVGTGYTTYTVHVAASTNDATTPEVIDIPDLSRGIYFVAVQPGAYGAWGGASYAIKSEFTVFPPVVSDDIGDKREYALPVVNQLPTICSLSGSGDVDYFECHLPYNSDLTLSLTEIAAGGNVDLEVYTAWGILVGAATQPGQAEELLYLADLVPGQYFVKVFGEGAGPYTFKVIQEFSEASDILDEVGNDLTHAMPLLVDNPSVFCLQPYGTDNDMFSVFQPQDGPLTVDVYNMFLYDGREDLYVSVLDEYGKVIARSDNGTGTPEHIEAQLVRGQYFIDVQGEAYGNFGGAIYTIDVKTNGSDVGDAFNRALQIHAIPYGSETYGYPYVGMIDRPEDADFFQIVLKDEGFIYLEVDRMLHADVDVQLFDAYHGLLQTSANPGTDLETIYVDDLDPGMYFVKVASTAEGIGQYRLTPTIGTPTSPISDDIGDDTALALPLVPYRRANGYVSLDATSDYFEFVLADDDSAVRVRVGNQHVWDLREDVELYIYDAAGNQIGSSDNDVLEDETVELSGLDAGVYYARVRPTPYGNMGPVQYTIVVETEAAPQPSAELMVPADVQGAPGQILNVSVLLANDAPEEITSLSLGVQFDPSVLEPVGANSAGLMLEQWNAQVRYARTENTISVSMDNFSTVQSGEILQLVFRVQGDAGVGDTSVLVVLTPTLNGAVVPATDGLVTVVGP